MAEVELYFDVAAMVGLVLGFLLVALVVLLPRLEGA